jgi:ribonucleoside-diphosphate reductase alpha chain
LHGIAGLPEAGSCLFVTAVEIPVERHLQVQAAFQQYVDNSVSKTINLPYEAAPEGVAQAYWRVLELGLQDISINRDGSKAAQGIELGVSEEPQYYDHPSKCDPEECKV